MEQIKTNTEWVDTVPFVLESSGYLGKRATTKESPHTYANGLKANSVFFWPEAKAGCASTHSRYCINW